MTQEHPITPPPELIEQWMQVHTTKYDLARQAVQWAADAELEACCNYIVDDPVCGTKHQRRMLMLKLRQNRRPNPVEPTDKQLCETYLEGYYANENRQGPDAQAAGLRAVIKRWGTK